MRCPACGTENENSRKFCGECGSALARACPSCGSPNSPTVKFCGECGTALAGPVPTGSVSSAASAEAVALLEPTSERRLVSVLFADLVGFTTLSEERDAEEVRELLSHYFETSRRLISRYGGVVEKFIGDAVMAVWGTPIAQEDDAERAVRAALDLTAAVSALGQEVGAPTLRSRAGVLTGEAAVTIGAQGQGMVAGDLVNTASRIQSAAPPGSVFVGEVTRRSTEAAIAYEDVGTHELKGKAEPVPLWRAVRVLAGVGGAQKSTGLEAPFVGRDRELHLIKELFHVSAEEHKAHLVSVIGAAGVGKSRLSWEFFKYIDGLADTIRWHRGRCLPYGEGVSFWALAEMVRTRASIVEGEDPLSAAAKLHQAVEETLSDSDERRWVEPRLANLLGFEERSGKDQEGLFAAWRLFYEHLADEMPTVMVFEDMQWADAALFDFVEYLLEWSRSHALFVVSLARPELATRRPTWGAAGRSFTSIYLEPLSSEAMESLLTGLVPGLPDELRGQIRERAEGVPLYAVETVRMLLDRGLLSQEGAVYRPTGPIDTLEVPETLHALIAARLDGLTPPERRLVQNASVLGKTFTIGGITAVTGLLKDELELLLASLVRKEVLSLLADPLSPERGQYAFLQDLVKRVAYETLSKKERKARHIAAASFIESAWGPDEEEFVEVVAAHLHEAYRLGPEAPDAPALRSKARDMLVRAGERAGSLAAPSEAMRYFDEAAELTGDDAELAELLERAGLSARASGDVESAGARFDRAIELFERAGRPHPAARVKARVAELLWDRGRFADAVKDMDRSFQILATEEPDEDVAELAAQLGRFLFFSGDTAVALERVEAAIDVAESLFLPEVLSEALNTKAIICYSALGRRREGYALLQYALEVALENDAVSAALRAYFNLADLAARADRYQEAANYVDSALALARRIGNRFWEWQLLGQVYPLLALGEWDELLERLDQLPVDRAADVRGAFIHFMLARPLVHLYRGDLDLAERAASVFPNAEESDDVQERATWRAGRAALALARGRTGEALEEAERGFADREEVGLTAEAVKEAFVVAIEAAWRLGEFVKVDELLAVVDATPRGHLSQFYEAQTTRFRGRLAERGGDLVGAEERLKGAVGLFRELESPFWTAVCELELAERVRGWGRDDEAVPLLEAARSTFERLGALPWLERVDAATALDTRAV